MAPFEDPDAGERLEVDFVGVTVVTEDRVDAAAALLEAD